MYSSVPTNELVLNPSIQILVSMAMLVLLEVLAIKGFLFDSVSDDGCGSICDDADDVVVVWLDGISALDLLDSFTTVFKFKGAEATLLNLGFTAAAAAAAGGFSSVVPELTFSLLFSSMILFKDVWDAFLFFFNAKGSGPCPLSLPFSWFTSGWDSPVSTCGGELLEEDVNLNRFFNLDEKLFSKLSVDDSSGSTVGDLERCVFGSESRASAVGAGAGAENDLSSFGTAISEISKPDSCSSA
ncbi:hypothetical protein WICPIJ_000920 [Wickerhamomyces pijperi]|uniref:Uncharacterized protein n=1 Tax=Wickerhamomyces pijperi TaxID=599730 RepID=A0A9P8QCP1_WICPI|nr:hypothetical protein WICPIJ_000920 [Wickerhamomyces pijperi]